MTLLNWDEDDDQYDDPPNDWEDDWQDEEADVSDCDCGCELVRLWRVEGVTRPEPGRFGYQFCHVTLARTADEAQAKVAAKIPPFSNVTATYAVN